MLTCAQHSQAMVADFCGHRMLRVQYEGTLGEDHLACGDGLRRHQAEAPAGDLREGEHRREKCTLCEMLK